MLVALVVAALAMLALPLGARRMIDNGFSGTDPSLINNYFMVMILIGLVLAMASAIRFYLVTTLGERVVADLRNDVFAHLTELDPSFYERTRSGEVMSRLTADTTQVKAAVGTAFSQSLRNLVLFLGALIMMILTSGWLSLLVLVAIPLIVLPLVAYGRVVKQLSRKAQDTLASASAYAAENLSAIRTLQAFTNEKMVAGKFIGAVAQSVDAAVQRIRARAGLTGIAVFLVFASVIGVLWVGAHSVMAGTMSAGTLGQFVLYAVVAASSLGELSEVYGEVQQAAGSTERLMELLAEEPAIKSPANPVPLVLPLKGALAFDTLTFRYGLDEKRISALEGVSFAVAPGETVAIVGPSGAGKSTIFNMVMRFYDPNAGTVTIDGLDVRKLDLTALRSQIAMVPQEVSLFADSVAENIRYGRAGASLADVKAAAVTANAAGFIEALPQGYETILGERGQTISGGQRQRIAIARAVLKNAPVLLLDEATSALDAESERQVQSALERIMQGRTTLVIAHRLATVKRADRIIVLDGGRVVETGKHAELVAKGGLYSRLATLEFKDDEGS